MDPLTKKTVTGLRKQELKIFQSTRKQSVSFIFMRNLMAKVAVNGPHDVYRITIILRCPRKAAG